MFSCRSGRSTENVQKSESMTVLKKSHRISLVAVWLLGGCSIYIPYGDEPVVFGGYGAGGGGGTAGSVYGTPYFDPYYAAYLDPYTYCLGGYAGSPVAYGPAALAPPPVTTPTDVTPLPKPVPTFVMAGPSDRSYTAGRVVDERTLHRAEPEPRIPSSVSSLSSPSTPRSAPTPRVSPRVSTPAPRVDTGPAPVVRPPPSSTRAVMTRPR